MYRSFERLAEITAITLALAGGGVLLLLTGATCVSIIGRAALPFDIGLGPIRGIYDITEIGVAAAIFAFLPWAQLTGAHARVDLFRRAIPDMLDRMLDLIFSTAMAMAAIFGTWRLYLGMQDKIAFEETTLIAQLPVWQGYAGALVGASGFVLVACFCVLRAGRRLAGIADT